MPQGDTSTSPQSGTTARRGSTAGSALYRLVLQGRSWSARERNCCFLNLGNGRFADISAASGFDFPDDGRALGIVDWDSDGDLDMWVVNRSGPQLRLLRNDLASDHHWLALRLVGNGTTSNRDAIGARVSLQLRSAPQENRPAANARAPLLASLRAGDGFLSQSTKWLHFGLGDADRIERVVVHWPDGSTEEFSGLVADSRYRIVQGKGRAEPWPEAPRARSALRPTRLAGKRSTQTARIRSAARLPLPPLEYTTFGGQAKLVGQGDGRQPSTAILLNLWASWCQPCLSELNEFARHEQQLREAGIDIIALSVDGLEGEPRSSATAAQQILTSIDFPFRAGLAARSTIEKLQLINDHLFNLHRPLGVPTSILLDTEGRIAVIYRGPVDVNQLLGDVPLQSGKLEQLYADSVPFEGKWQEHRSFFDPYDLAWNLADLGYFDDALPFMEKYPEQFLLRKPQLAELQFKIGAERFQAGDAAAAEQNYRTGLELDPTRAKAYLDLGVILASQGRQQEAIDQYRRALSHGNGNHPRALQRLASALAASGKENEALRYYLRLLEIEPENPVVHDRAAALLAAAGNWKRAAYHLQQVLRLDPNDAGAHFNLGNTLAQQRQFTTAIGHFQRAVELAPDFLDAHQYLAKTLKIVGRTKEAEEHLEQVRRLQRNP